MDKLMVQFESFVLQRTGANTYSSNNHKAASDEAREVYNQLRQRLAGDDTAIELLKDLNDKEGMVQAMLIYDSYKRGFIDGIKLANEDKAS